MMRGIRKTILNGTGKMLLSTLLVSTAIAAGLAITHRDAVAQAQAQTSFSVPAGPLNRALTAFGRQAGVQVTYLASVASAKTSPGFSGAATQEQALARILEGTGLRYSFPNATTVAISANVPGASNKSADGSTVLNTITVQGQGNSTVGTYASDIPTNIGTPLGLTAKETPQSISVVTRQKIDDQSLSNVKEVLQQTPGLTISEMGGDRYNIYARGYALSQIQLDGMDNFTDMSTQEVPLDYADMIIYDRVEVLRGANGLMSGAGQPSGTINLVRKQPTDAFQGYVSGGTGSWGKYRGELDVSGPLNELGTLRGRLVAAHQTNESFIDYVKQDRSVLYGVVEADVTDTTTVTLGVDYQKRDGEGTVTNVGLPLYANTGQQIFGIPRSFNPANRDNRVENDSANVFAKLKQDLGDDWVLNASVNYLHHESDFDTIGAATWSGFLNPATGGGLQLYNWAGNSLQRQTSVDANVGGSIDLFGQSHELVFGMKYQDYLNETDYTTIRTYGSFNLYDWQGNGAATTSLPRYSDTAQTQFGAYAAGRFNLSDNLHLITGMRWNRFENSYTLERPGAAATTKTTASDNGQLIPYAGIVFDLTDEHSAYASYTTIYNPQTNRDRFGNYLAPREGSNYELGLKSDLFDGRLNTSISAYHMRLENVAHEDGAFTVPGTDATAYRPVDATTKGFELEASGEIFDNLRLSASYAYSRSEDVDGLRISTTAPEHLARLWATYQLPGEWEKLTIGAGVNWQSKIYYSGTTWRAPGVTLTAEQPAYATVNLMAKYDFNENVTATFNVNNVFDKTYLSAIDTTYYSTFYGAPRNFTLDMKYKF